MLVELFVSFAFVAFAWLVAAFAYLDEIVSGSDTIFSPLSAVLLGGGVGLVGMYRLSIVVIFDSNTRISVFTYIAVCIGISAISPLVLLGAEIPKDRESLLSIVLVCAPIICAMHFIYLSRSRHEPADNH